MASKTVTIICNDSDYFLRHRRMVADRLAAAGHDVLVVTGGRVVGADEAVWPHRHAEIRRFAFHPVHDGRLALLTIRDAVLRKLDTLHLVTLKPAVICGLAALAARRMGPYPRRVVITLPGLGRLMGAMSSKRPGRARRLTEWALRRMGRHESFVVTFETEHDRQTLLRTGLVSAERSVVLPGAGVDPDLFKPREERREPGRLRVLFASRLLRAKGLDVFLAVAEKLAAGGGFEFLVAGMADDADPDGYTRQALAAHGSVTFLGEVADMPRLLRSVDVVCLPTRYAEGIPRILIEAAACRLGIIASDAAGCREVVIDDRTGFVLPESDFAGTGEAMARHLEAYRADPALLERHADAARRHFLESGFGEKAVTDAFVDILTRG